MKKLQNSPNPRKFKQIGLTKAKTKPLVDLGFVELVIIQNKKGTLKTPNACKITDKGSAFLEFLENPHSEISVDISKLERQIKSVEKVLNNISISFQNLNSKINGMNKNIKPRSLEIHHVIKSFQKFKGKLSGVAPLNKVIDDLVLQTNLSSSLIEAALYDMYVKKKVILLEGKGSKPMRSPDGDEFALIKIEW